MAAIVLKFVQKKVIELTINRELTLKEIEEIKNGTFDPECYEHKSDVTSYDDYWESSDFEFEQMEFGADEDQTYDIIFNTDDLTEYEEYLDKQRLKQDPTYIEPHGKPLFN